MHAWLTTKRTLAAAALALGLVWPMACSESSETFPGGVGAGSGTCVVDGQPCPQGCDENLGCVDCLDNDDCGAALPHCVAGDCVECEDNTDCPAGQTCYPRDHECHDACETSGDCDGPEPICDPDTGACVGCLTNDDCQGERPICSSLTRQCVECDTDAHCGAAEPICDLEDGRCRECLLDIHCPAARPYCDDHHCVDRPTCDPPLSLCGTNCVDTNADPDHCGSCGNDCGNREYCSGGSCTCRPGLTDVSGSCVDLDSDPDNCGTPGNGCDGATPQCEGGVCVDGCSDGLRACDDACVDVSSHPLHCGDCGERCEADEICVDGGCQRYEPAIGCTSCPCDACRGDRDTCCPYPGDPGLTICVEGGGC